MIQTADCKTILFLGGSITCGASATDYENSWPRLVYHKVANTLYGENVQMINASISGTGSNVAVFRLREHVLPYCPDFVFIEFAVNDRAKANADPELVIANLDYIVRTLKQTNPNVAVTFVYTTARGKNASSVHGIVAKHYGIPEIDLQTPLTALVDSGKHSWDDFFKDSVHPNDNGHAKYADIIVNEILQDKERFLSPVNDAPSISKYPFVNPHILPADMATSMNGFTMQSVTDRSKIKRLPELLIHRAALSDRIGDSIIFEFEGEHFAVYHRIGNYSGRFSVTIDGKFIKEVDTYHLYGDGTSIFGEFVSFFTTHSLGAGKHTAEITIIEPNPASKSSEICITGVFIG